MNRVFAYAAERGDVQEPAAVPVAVLDEPDAWDPRAAHLTESLDRAAASLLAALNGRVMRLLLATQRAWRSARDFPAARPLGRRR